MYTMDVAQVSILLIGTFVFSQVECNPYRVTNIVQATGAGQGRDLAGLTDAQRNAECDSASSLITLKTHGANVITGAGPAGVYSVTMGGNTLTYRGCLCNGNPVSFFMSMHAENQEHHVFILTNLFDMYTNNDP